MTSQEPAAPRLRAQDVLCHAFFGDEATRSLRPTGGRAVYVRGRIVLLGGDDPLAPAVRAWAESTGSARQYELRRLAHGVAERLGGDVAVEPVTELPADTVGSLPTAAVLMEVAALGDPEDLLAGLGGAAARYRAADDRRLLLQLPGLDSQAMFLLSRFETGCRIEDALRQAAVGREVAVATLARLAAVRLLLPVSPALAPVAAGDDDVLGRFRERLARELAAEPLAMAPELHRAKVADLLTRHGGLDHYELLEVDVAATDEELHGAYERLARLVHPIHARRLELPRPAALELLFEHATEAYRVLSDPRQRSAYNLQHGLAAGERRNVHERRAEQRVLARQRYEKAARCMTAEQYHYAVELLREAVRLDPQPEYQALLARSLGRNPHWREEARKLFARAVELNPADAGSCFGLGELEEAEGRGDEAIAWYRKAVEAMPGHPDATLALERLGVATRPAKKKLPNRGWLA